MDSIRVVINKVEVGYFSAAEMGLSVTWATKNIGEINSFRTTQIKTVKLPLINEVKVALKSPSELDQTEGTSQKRLDTIDIYINESQNIQGWIKPLKTVVGKLGEYLECTFKSRERNWIDGFKDLTITDIDFSDFNHTLTAANIRASEVAGSGLPYCYAPIDIAEIGRRQVLWVIQTTVGAATDTDFYYLGEQKTGTFTASTYGFTNSTLHANSASFTDVADVFWNARGIYIARATSITATSHYDQWGYMSIPLSNWQVGDFYPSISIKELITRAYANIGYNAQFILPEQWINDDYHFWHNPTQLSIYQRARDFFKVKVYGTGYVFTGFMGPLPFIVPFFNTTDEGYQPNTRFIDTNSDVSANVLAATNVSKFVASEKTIVRFKWNYDVKITVSAPAIEFSIKHYDSFGTLKRTLIEETQSSLSSTGATFTGTYNTNNVFMELGDYVQCELYSWRIAITTLEIFKSNTLESIPFEGGNFKGKTIRLDEYLPEVTAYDWIKDIALKKNLQFYTNEPLKTVYLVPDDLKRTGKKIDWSRKLNRIKDVEIEEIGALHPKTYRFNWKKDDNDELIDEIEVVSEERYATGTIANTNQFTIEEKAIDLAIYSPSHNKESGSNNIYFECAEMYGVDKKRTDYEPRYLKILFEEPFLDHDFPVDGLETSVDYRIEGDTPTSTYLFATFPRAYWWDTLLTTFYVTMIRRILYGWILRGYFFISDVDVDGFANVLESGNDFRADYWATLNGVEIQTEALKVIDYSPANPADTRCELVFFRDNP